MIRVPVLHPACTGGSLRVLRVNDTVLFSNVYLIHKLPEIRENTNSYKIVFYGTLSEIKHIRIHVSSQPLITKSHGSKNKSVSLDIAYRLIMSARDKLMHRIILFLQYSSNIIIFTLKSHFFILETTKNSMTSIKQHAYKYFLIYSLVSFFC